MPEGYEDEDGTKSSVPRGLINLITHASWEQPAPPAQTRHVINCICGDGRPGDSHQHGHGR